MKVDAVTHIIILCSFINFSTLCNMYINPISFRRWFRRPNGCHEQEQTYLLQIFVTVTSYQQGSVARQYVKFNAQPLPRWWLDDRDQPFDPQLSHSANSLSTNMIAPGVVCGKVSVQLQFSLASLSAQSWTTELNYIEGRFSAPFRVHKGNGRSYYYYGVLIHKKSVVIVRASVVYDTTG